MARGKKKKAASSYYCSLCDFVCGDKEDLEEHMRDHEETRLEFLCSVCHFPFADQLALEQHSMQTEHQQEIGVIEESETVYCERCERHLDVTKFRQHRTFPFGECCDANKNTKNKKTEDNPGVLYRNAAPNYGPRRSHRPPQEITVSSLKSLPHTQVSASADGPYCPVCKTTFVSEYKYNSHFLSCRPTATPELVQHMQQRPVPAEEQLVTWDSVVDPPAVLSTAVKKAPVPLDRPIDKGKPDTAEVASAKNTMSDRKVVDNDRAGVNLPESSRSNVPVQPLKHSGKSGKVPLASNVAARARTTVSTTVSAQDQASAKSAGASSGLFRCVVKSCGRSFKSEAGLKVHRADTHSIGGTGLDLHGKDSWMLSQKAREQLKQGLLLPSGPPQGPSRKASGRRKPAPAVQPLRQAVLQHITNAPRASQPPAPAPIAASVGGYEEVAQADELCTKIMRLVLQSDVLLHHTGSIACGGIKWTRISVAKQGDAVKMFDTLCHLPKAIQDEEFISAPKTFKDEHHSPYRISEFEHSPDRGFLAKPLAVVAVSCIKIVLVDNCQEVVKVAAVDVVTGRILLNHLVCTDHREAVRDWRTNITGLTSFQDLEQARQDGYKILRGWQSARAALWKYVDKQTIIIGHNVRSDLDTLRMIHGRAVDVAKLVEKAAQGPLSKQQIRLDALCRDLKQITLTTDSKSGRDVLHDAFAVRELGLWRIKNEEAWAKWAKNKTLEYQRLGLGSRA